MFLIQAIDLDAVTVVGIIVLGDAVAVGIRIINIGNPVAVGIVLFKTGFGAAFAAARDSEGTTDDENRKQAKNGMAVAGVKARVGRNFTSHFLLNT